MQKAERDGDSIFTSVSQFFMDHYSCDKSLNGYYQWHCVTGKCKNCKCIKTPSLKSQGKYDETVTYSQFETLKYTHKKKDKDTGKEVDKKSEKTEWVLHHSNHDELYEKLSAMRKVYVMHQYQVNNDNYEWPHILSTVDTYGTIKQMDYSENLSQLYKHEAQSCHFSKKQFTLHCTVENRANEERNYMYHLSNGTKHNFGFTFFGKYFSELNNINNIFCIHPLSPRLDRITTSENYN